MPLPLANALHTAAQVRAIDRAAIDRCGIAGIELMRRAAEAAYASLRRRWPQARRILLLVGSGNNGGDALLLGVLALRDGLAVDALALPGMPHGDAATARASFAAAGGTLREADGPGALPAADVVVDGLFGTGLARPLEGVAAALVQRLRDARLPTLALDLPSGLDADSGVAHAVAVRADATVCFVAWKRGLFTADAADACGARELADLGIPPQAREGIEPDSILLDPSIDHWLPPRQSNSNKGRYGHVLVAGGDLGMGGAPRLAGEAALRCGAGLVSVATRASHVAVLLAGRPELMASAVESAEDLAPLLERASVIAIGPGLGKGEWGGAMLSALLAAGRPCVLDADALNLIAQAPRRLPDDAILTPHPGEAARLLDSDIGSVQRDRHGAVRELARRWQATCVLKGSGTLVADPAGRLATCPWGNPGMASAGMGDVLTGVIAALRAQGLDAWRAACLGVAWHARAGDIAAGASPRGLLASDLFAPLRELANGASR